MTTDQKAAAAIATLEHLGYTHTGGELWRGPLGEVPNFDLVDHWRAKADELSAQVEALTKYIRPVYLVATGEVHEGQETYTRHDAPVPLADQEVLFTRPCVSNSQESETQADLSLTDSTRALTRPAVPTLITEEMHQAACKVLLRATGLDGTPQRMLDAMLAVAPEVTRPAVPDKGLLADLIREHMTGVYHCGRVWEAWSVGTMSEDDFSPYVESDSPDELADAILAMLASHLPEAQPYSLDADPQDKRPIDPAAPSAQNTPSV